MTIRHTCVVLLAATLASWRACGPNVVADEPKSTSRPTFESAPTIQSWSKFQDELKPMFESSGNAEYESLLKSATFASLAAMPDVSLSLEMCRKFDKTPLVAIAGLRLLQKHHPKNAMEGALLHFQLYEREMSLYLLAYAMEELEVKHDQPLFDAQFERFARQVPIDDRTAAILTSSVPVKQLHAWYHNRQETPISANLEAYVLSTLYGHENDSPSIPTERMRGRLQHLERVPGSPRLVYLENAVIDIERRVAILKLVLCDEELDDGDIVMAISRSDELIQEKIAIDELAMTPKRREVAKRALARATTRPTPNWPTTRPGR